jgi:O-antigen ligase/Tfp pilus assembly protein PilF
MGKKSRLKKKKVVEVGPKRDWLVWSVFWGLCVLLFYPPFFRALFFTKEQLPAFMFTYVLFGAWWVVKWRRRDGFFVGGYLDWCVLGLVIAYAVSLLVAVNIRGALQEFLKVGNYFLIYWLVAQVCAGKRELKVVLNVLVLGALGVALLGLGAAAGTWSVHGGFLHGRIYSTIQYPNSLAAYLTGAFLVAMALAQTEGRWQRVYLSVGYLVLLAAVLTHSRGGWLVMPVFLALYLLLLPGKKRGQGLLGVGLVCFMVMVFAPLVTGAYQGGSGAATWLLALVGLALVVLLHFLSGKVRVNARVLAVGFGVVVLVVVLAVGVVVVKGDWERFLPEVLAERLSGFSLGERNVQERFVFYGDALKIIRDYPVLGLGGQGWKSRYFQYQSYGYATTEVHNHFLQVWVETGILGFLLFVGIWGSLIYALPGLRRTEEESGKVLAVGATCGALVVVFHSLLDFNLSLGALGIFTFALAGAVRSMLPKREVMWRPYRGMAALAVAGALLAGVFSLYLGHSAFNRGVARVRVGDISGGIKFLEQAVRYDRFDPEIRVFLAEAYEKKGDAKRAEEELLRAVGLDRYQPRYSNLAGVFYVRAGNFDEGLEWLGKAVELQPKNFRSYVVYGRALLHIGEQYFGQGRRSEGEKYLRRLEELALAMEETGNPGALSYIRGQAYYMLDEQEKAAGYLEQALASREDRARAAAVLSLLWAEKGEEVKAGEYYQKALEWDGEIAAFVEMMKKL